MSTARKRTEWNRDLIAQSILQGQLLTVYHDKVLRLNSWLGHHPGGELALLHFVGRDATDEIEAYHSEETLSEKIDRYCVGVLAPSEKKSFVSLIPPIMLGFTLSKSSSGDCTWVPLGGSIRALSDNRALQTPSISSATPCDTPPVSEPDSKPISDTLQIQDLYPPSVPAPLSTLELQQAHTKSYRQLHKKVRDAGLYKSPGFLSGYGGDCVRYILLAVTAIWAWNKGIQAEAGWTRKGWLSLAAVSLGLFWQQLTFVAHDAGHTSILGNGDYIQNRLLGTFVANWIGGLSLGWWCDNHNIHHLVTNHPEHDPDIQHLPFFAISPIFFDSIFSTYYNARKPLDKFAQFVIPFQHKTYYVVLLLARFNLYVLSYAWLAKCALGAGGRKKERWFNFEVMGLIIFWAWFGYGVLGSLDGKGERTLFLLISHVMAAPVHVQIVLSHFSRSTEDLGVLESFAHRQLRTTMDVICPPSIEFIHGGLDKQVTHHLFPRLPRHNLRQASLLVKEFCEEQQIEFAEWTFVEGNKQVLGVLRDVADQLKFIGKVAQAEAKGELSQGK
ncbi:delta 8-sphingolipid desaturase [Phaffia rhodozyma]|uniref:Delta 8-(E)-sphingolipid desaturase n=1 Tax=Phaffia rhodozyma TaxID=264483 RepID=A0A0F7SGE1_PHARH|nr:delta 8-sphingolipid desaturase [Phaffia rhodozyma]